MTDDPPGLPPVELHVAFSWTCDACGADNFARAVTVEPEAADAAGWDDAGRGGDPGQFARVREWIGRGGEGSWILTPAFVECRTCLTMYRAEG